LQQEWEEQKDGGRIKPGRDASLHDWFRCSAPRLFHISADGSKWVGSGARPASRNFFVTKHLRVLERVGLVRCAHAGREAPFEFDSGPVGQMREYLEFVSAKWDEALGRLKALVEE
jgi:hypothetical protein